MITSTMTANEILDVFDKDFDRVKAFMFHKQKAIRRELLKSRKKLTTRSFEYKTDNAEYILSIFCDKKGDAHMSTFAYVRDTNEYLFKAAELGMRTVMSFSVHLLKRFAERELNNRELPMTEILREFNKQFFILQVYSDKQGRRVFAMPNGLVLGKYDTKRDMLLHKTYVSTDMLTQSQYEAWEIMFGHINQLLEYREKYGVRSKQSELYKYLHFGSYIEPISVLQANSIYAQFYEGK